ESERGGDRIRPALCPFSVLPRAHPPWDEAMSARAAALALFNLTMCACQSSPPLEPTPQHIEVTINQGIRSTRDEEVTLKIRATLEDRPPAEMALSHDGQKWDPWRPFAPMVRFRLTDGEGEKKIFLKLISRTGAESLPVSASILLDRTPPLASFNCSPLGPEGPLLLLRAVPGAVAMPFSEDSETWGGWEPYARPKVLPVTPGTAIRKIHGRFRDEAGNVSDVLGISVDLSKAAPAPEPAIRQVSIAALARGAKGLGVD